MTGAAAYYVDAWRALKPSDRLRTRQAAVLAELNTSLSRLRRGEELGQLRKPMPKAVPPKRRGLLSINEAAQHLNVTADQIKAFTKDGELQYINVGRGKKRPRMRFTIANLDEFIERRQRRDVPCQSTKNQTRPTTTSTSKPEVIGFTALRAAQLAKMPKGSKR